MLVLMFAVILLVALVLCVIPILRYLKEKKVVEEIVLGTPAAELWAIQVGDEKFLLECNWSHVPLELKFRAESIAELTSRTWHKHSYSESKCRTVKVTEYLEMKDWPRRDHADVSREFRPVTETHILSDFEDISRGF